MGPHIGLQTTFSDIQQSRGTAPRLPRRDRSNRASNFPTIRLFPLRAAPEDRRRKRMRTETQ
ncbi:hypothetical protein BURPS305_3617 [Burkholderia pseudomallei 305]|nr:hypothetical protein BURPS305_3617 [Burkholderia pseudomallei 305]